MDGIAVRAADTLGASETTPVYLTPDGYDVVDTGDPMPGGRDAVVMREHVHYRGKDAELRAAVPPYQHVRSIGEDISTAELLLTEGHRLRAADLAAAAAAGATQLLVRRLPVVAVLPTGDEVRPIGTEPGPGEILDTNSLMLATQAREAGCEAHRLPIEPDDPARLAAAVSAAVTSCDLLIIVAGSSAGRDDYTARIVAELGTLAVHGVAVRPGHPVVLGAVAGTPVLGAPGYPVSAALTFDIFAEPLLAELEGAVPRAARGPGPGWPASSPPPSAWTTGCGSASAWWAARWSPPRCPAAPACSPPSSAPTACWSCRPGRKATTRVRRSRSSCCGAWPRSRTRSSPSAPTTSCSTSPPPRCAPRTRVTLASANVGSLGGLVALRDGLCHIAGSHLLDPATGGYTLPYVDRILAGADVGVVRLVHRDQGLMVAPGNPLGLTGIGGLARPGMRYINRQRGAGTRVLLDHELSQRGISPADIGGYSREEPTHLGVAAAVAAGRGDAGLGILAAARAFGLDFVPVAREPYDLVVTAEALASARLAPLWALLQSGRFAQRSRNSAATPRRRWAAASAEPVRRSHGEGDPGEALGLGPQPPLGPLVMGPPARGDHAPGTRSSGRTRWARSTPRREPPGRWPPAASAARPWWHSG